jgi:polar amino acid transport system substrate-binding protein
MNASINAFLDQIKANGELGKVYEKWMKRPLPPMPETVEGVSFVAS